MRRRYLSLPVCALALTLSTASVVTVDAAPPHTVFVVNAQDVGPGSFRHAINLANSNPSITRVQFLWKWTVALQHTVYFSGVQDLTIDGGHSTLNAAGAGGDAFVANGGGNLVVSNLTVRNATGEGLEVQIPPGSTGTVRVSLFNVTIKDNLGHGVLVDDQISNTDASIDVSVFASRFLGNGFGDIDRDGLRVNEGGLGNLIIKIVLSVSEGNGADGIEADEKGDGDVRVEMFASGVHGNGSFTSADFDDGFDIDEEGNGSILGKIVLSAANDNYEEGFDFNENHAGDLKVDMLLVEASRNAEEGIDYEEDDDETAASSGGIVTTMELVKANGNKGGDAGIKIRERASTDPANTTDPGDLTVTLKGVETSNNFVTDAAATDGGRGIFIREDGVGSMIASVTNAKSLANESHGIDFDENGAGDATVSVTNANSSNNGVPAAVIPGAGVRADEGGAGAGTATLTNVTLQGNTELDGTAGNLLP